MASAWPRNPLAPACLGLRKRASPLQAVGNRTCSGDCPQALIVRRKAYGRALVAELRAIEADVGATGVPADGGEALAALLAGGVVWGDAEGWLAALPTGSVDLFFTSPPYADARPYSRVHPDRYVEWFLPFSAAMLEAARPSGSFVLNIKNKASRGQRHTYVYELVIALKHQGWRWVETYIWHKPNAMPGRFGPRTKDAFEYVYHFAKGTPYFDLDAVRVPYKTPESEIERRRLDTNGRRTTKAGYGRDRSQTYGKGGADPGNVVSVPQTYNQHHGVRHTAAMPERLAEWFVSLLCPAGGVVVDPFAGSGTTVVAARRLGRQAGGIELHEDYVAEAQRRISIDARDARRSVTRAAE